MKLIKKSKVEFIVEDLKNNLPFEDILKKYPGLTVKSLGDIIKYKLTEEVNNFKNILDLSKTIDEELKKN